MRVPRTRSRGLFAAIGVVLALALAIEAQPIAAARAAPSDVVLGSPDAFAPYGKGWGTAKPRRIFNGGVPNGLVRKIHWKDWGGATAEGAGRGYQYKPEGGYYSRTVEVQLRAKHIGRCPGHSKRAYTVLRARFQNKPGGHFGRWFAWAGLDTIC